MSKCGGSASNLRPSQSNIAPRTVDRPPQVLVFVVQRVLTHHLQDGRDQEEDAGDEDGEGHGHGQGRHLRGPSQGREHPRR